MSNNNKTKTLYKSKKNVDISAILDNGEQFINNSNNVVQKMCSNNIIQGGGGQINTSANKKKTTGKSISNNKSVSKNTKSIGKNTKRNKNNDDFSADESEYGNSDSADSSAESVDSDDSDVNSVDDVQGNKEIDDYGDEEDDEDKHDNSDNEDNDNKSQKSEQDDNSYADDKEEKDYIGDEETLKSKCYTKYAKVDYDELDFDELFGEETLVINKNIKLSKPILTKYEFVRLLTDRTKQLAQGAKPMLKNIQGLSSKEIAKLELKNKIIPLIIERPVPNSHVERWKLTELEIPEHLFTN